MFKKVITYGRFDVFHRGHINLLSVARGLGTHLTVGLSTDSYATLRGKTCINSFEDRFIVLSNMMFVDKVIPEMSHWGEKEIDIKLNNIDLVALGEEYADQETLFKKLCEVVIIKRYPGISSTEIKNKLFVKEENK
jgi:glycerol-3-phosphate cytidylyltransferase